MFITRNGIHFLEICCCIIPSVTFTCFFKRSGFLTCNCSLYYSALPRASSDWAQKDFGVFQQRQLPPLNSKLSEPQCYKETEGNRFLKAALTDHFALVIAKDGDTRDQVY